MSGVAFLVHMHKKHGFFILDVEYLGDPKGFLSYLGLKAKKYYMCLSCYNGCHPFGSLEAIQKCIKAKIHFKVHNGDDEEKELEEFYDDSQQVDLPLTLVIAAYFNQLT